jgi:hypothetical protein
MRDTRLGSSGGQLEQPAVGDECARMAPATQLTRRTVLRSAGVTALAIGGVGVLAACGGSSPTTAPASRSSFPSRLRAPSLR